MVGRRTPVDYWVVVKPSQKDLDHLGMIKQGTRLSTTIADGLSYLPDFRTWREFWPIGAVRQHDRIPLCKVQIWEHPLYSEGY